MGVHYPVIDLNEVRMFVTVVRARSFAEAARRLGMPPNTLSRRIRQLEAALETRLMQRSTRKLTLTAAGNAYFERCAAAVDGVVEAGRELLSRTDNPSGSVRVAAPADFLDVFRLEWVAEFLSLHPQVRLDFILNDARADLIDEGIDVAFRGGRIREPVPVFRRITSQHLILVASPAYLAARGTPRRPEELARHDCLTVSSRHGRAMWTLEGPRGDEQVKVAGRFSANSTRALLAGCVAGLGIGMLPTLPIAAELRAGRLVQVLPEFRRGGADFNVVLPSDAQIPAAVSTFVEFALEKLRAVVPELLR